MAISLPPGSCFHFQDDTLLTLMHVGNYRLRPHTYVGTPHPRHGTWLHQLGRLRCALWILPLEGPPPTPQEECGWSPVPRQGHGVLREPSHVEAQGLPILAPELLLGSQTVGSAWKLRVPVQACLLHFLLGWSSLQTFSTVLMSQQLLPTESADTVTPNLDTWMASIMDTLLCPPTQICLILFNSCMVFHSKDVV